MDPFTVFPVLETERFLLRETTPMDARDIFAVFSDEAVTRFYNLDTFTDLDQARHVVESRRRRFDAGQGIRWAIARKEDNHVIGSCGYQNWVRDWRKAELGYELGSAWWGQGIMTECLTEALRYGFKRMRLNRVEAMVVPGNDASVRVLQKLGFQEEGLLRQFGFWKGRFQDLRLFSLLAREWEPTS
jgi:[ribosomal protein S5]-alanine N-acetyltransferase